MISSKSIYLIAGIRLDSPLDYYAFGNILSACETINYKNRWQERARAVVIFSCKKKGGKLFMRESQLFHRTRSTFRQMGSVSWYYIYQRRGYNKKDAIAKAFADIT